MPLSKRSLDGTKWNRGNPSTSVASMERSGIEGIRQKFCVREVTPFVKAASPESQVELGGLLEGVALQRERRDTRHPPRQQSLLAIAAAKRLRPLYHDQAPTAIERTADTIMGVLRHPSIPLRCIEATLATRTKRLPPSSEPPTRSWACCDTPRFHFVASRLRLLMPPRNTRCDTHHEITAFSSKPHP